MRLSALRPAVAAQADAHVCLLDAIGIGRAAVMGGSAGAPSALQMAIRQRDRASALILLVPLGSIHMPALIFSSRDDRYGTFASAQYAVKQIAGAKCIEFDRGGHTWVGHDDEVMAEIVMLLVPPVKP